MSDATPEDAPPAHPLPLFTVLRDEFNELHADDPSLAQGDQPGNLMELYERIHGLAVPRTALCLSGGGIRSASFALGVLQALASHGLLKQFHYLSTVSGGGYIGSWLSAWRLHEGNDDAVFKSLAKRGGSAATPDEAFAEPVELQVLRANSNFLTPRLGLLSADTWTGIALYIRNFWLNWFIFGPLFLSVLLVPHASFDVLIWFNNTFGSLNWTVLAIAGLLLIVGLAMWVAGRPARDRDTLGGLPERPIAPGERRFLFLILLPVYLAAGFLATFAAWLPTTPDGMRWGILLAREDDRELFYPIAYAITFGALLYAVAWLPGFFLGGGRPGQLFAFRGTRRDPVPPFAEMICYAVSGAAAGAVGAFGIALYQHFSGAAENTQASQLLRFLLGGYNRIYMIVAAGVAWSMLAVLTADLLFTGLTSYHRRGDADREWSGRAAGFLAAAAIGWLGFSAVVLYGPPASAAILAMVGGSAGLVTLALGNSAKTAATFARRVTERFSVTTILSISTLIFILALAIFLSKIGRAGLDYAAAAMDAQEDTAVKAGISIGASIVLAGVSVLASYWINVNRFSLHAVYRNRLVRAFLGAARAGHRAEARTRSNPDPFTGFDQADNLPLASLWLPGGNAGRRRLFHVVNMALNVVASTNLAWQERKAEPFVMTPLACGNPYVDFVPTRFYGDRRSGVTLGTAMAISGAAVSPNQGYHTSPIIGLLLMLFNVRLGWWLGNPRSGPKFYRREGPLFSIGPVLDELAGRTTDTGRYAYLSDGGHFDNLGLYEMVRRRCRFILVSDAGADPVGALEDLGNAVRKIWIDLGVRIEFERVDVMPRQKPPVDGSYCALGRIHYPEAEGEVGTLVYVKPGFHGNEPPDIRAYAALHQDFPHESTADQWFSESQMESYRGLGSHIIEKMCGDQGDEARRACRQLDIDEFISSVTRYLENTRQKPPIASQPASGGDLSTPNK
jgi:hypothetical protein